MQCVLCFLFQALFLPFFSWIICLQLPGGIQLLHYQIFIWQDFSNDFVKRYSFLLFPQLWRLVCWLACLIDTISDPTSPMMYWTSFTMRVDLAATSIVISLGILPLMASKNACTTERKEREKDAYNSCGERQVQCFFKVNRERKKKNDVVCSELKDYRVAMKAGPDGRPDWVSRIFCNINNMWKIVSHYNFKVCAEGCMPCHTKSEIYAVQLEELGNSLERFSATFKSWDFKKCPVAR